MTKEERIIQLMAVDENTPTDRIDELLDNENTPIPDTEAQWKQFKSEHTHHHINQKWKVAAMVIVICLISGLAIAAIHHAISHYHAPNTTEAISIDTTKALHATTVQESAADTLPPAQAVEPLTPRTFEDIPLPTMLEELARHYDMEVVFHNATASNLRLYYEWNPEDSIQEVVNQLNTFNQIKITIDGNRLTVE